MQTEAMLEVIIGLCAKVTFGLECKAGLTVFRVSLKEKPL